MAFIQSASGFLPLVGGSASLAVAFTNANTGANCLIVDLIWSPQFGTTSTTATVTDSQGNTWTNIFTVPDPGGSGGVMASYIAPNCKAGANTVTATFSGVASFLGTMAVHEYSGIALSSPVDTYATGTNAGGSGTNSITVSITSGHSLEQLHTFACDLIGYPIYIAQANALPRRKVGSPLNPAVNAWNARVSIGISSGSTGRGMFSFDTPISQTAPASLGSEFVQVAATNSMFFGAAIIALKVVTIPLASVVNTLFSPATPWLLINEPVLGWTDRSAILDLTKKHKHTNTLQQRGTTDIPLRLKAANSYDPTQIEGCQILLFDQTPAGATLVWAGTIGKVAITWSNQANDRVATLTCVSLRQQFDTLRVPPQLFQSETADNIFATLFSTVAQGVPLTLGTLNAGFIVNSLNLTRKDRLSSAFDKLAKLASCIWDIDLATLTVYLQPPGTTAAPYTLQPKQVLFQSATFQLDRADYRNQQILQISPDAFSDSAELFEVDLPNGGNPITLSLLRPAQTIARAWLTNNTQNSATGSITALPSNGDTVTVGIPQSGSIYNWAPNSPYAVGQAIIDPSNHVQVVTTAGTSGASQPTWNDAGGNTSDGPGSPVQPGFSGGVVWTDRGLSGAGGNGAAVYTFVTVLDNTQWGQVLIGISPAQTLLNLQDAINCNALTQGQAFSFPTWENPLVNASGANGAATTFTVVSKTSGALYIATLAAASSAFSWSASETGGGVTALGTYDLQVAQNLSSNTANLYYTPGSNVIALASDPTTNQTKYLAVEYQRTDAGQIIVENTAQLNLRAAIENGTGKYQEFYSDTSITSNTEGLQYVQSILAAFDSVPLSFSFEAFPPGLLPGQLLTISLVHPTTLATLMNGTFFVQEVSGEFIPLQTPGGTSRWMNQTTAPGGGHYKYTVTVINESQIQTWLGFWAQLLGGSQ